MTLDQMAQLAEVVQGAAVVAAIVFGVVQWRQFEQQRGDLAGIELMHTLQDQSFTHAFRLLHALPDAMEPAALDALGPEHEEAALSMGACFETLGLMVYRGHLPLPLVEELVGGAILLVWRKLQPWTEATRVARGHPVLFEWFQWLAERLQERGRADQVPAFLAHADWRPAPSRLARRGRPAR